MASSDDGARSQRRLTPSTAAEQVLVTCRTLADDERGPILASIAGGWFLGVGVRLVLPALLPLVRAEFALGMTAAGTLVTVLWVAYALMQFPGGLLADYAGERTILVASCGISVAGLAIIAAAPRVGGFVAGTVLFGVGAGLYGTTQVTALSDVYPNAAGAAIGVSGAAGSLGTVVLPVLAGVLAASFGWRFGFAMTLPCYVAAMAWLWRTVPANTSPSVTGDDSRTDAARRLLGDLNQRVVLQSAAAMLLVGFVYQAFAGFFPTYLVDEMSLTSVQSSPLFGLFLGVGVVFQPLGGAASDRFGAARAMIVLIGVSVVGLFAIPFVAGTPLIVVATLLAGTHLGFWPIVFSYVTDCLADETKGSTLGLLRTGYLVPALSGLIAVGAMADAGLFDGAFVLLAGIAVLGC